LGVWVLEVGVEPLLADCPGEFTASGADCHFAKVEVAGGLEDADGDDRVAVDAVPGFGSCGGGGGLGCVVAATVEGAVDGFDVH